MCSLNVNELLGFEIISIDSYKEYVSIIISTDGIADDLIPEKNLLCLDTLGRLLIQMGWTIFKVNCRIGFRIGKLKVIVMIKHSAILQ